MENTKIEWADHTWNPWIGCTKVSPACDHCYAAALMEERFNRVRWGAGEDRLRTSTASWNEPLKWDRAASAAGKPATVFCLSLGDIWDNEVDDLWRRQAFDVMRATPHLIYLLLSKRIGNAEKMAGEPLLPPNAALGATMVSQDEWDRDIDKLLQAGKNLGARFTFASVEPMLGPIDARGRLPDWVIVGGESGRDARPMHPDWARSLREQCAAASVPFLFKQWGEFKYSPLVDGPCDHAECIMPDGSWLAYSAARAGQAAVRYVMYPNAALWRDVHSVPAGAVQYRRVGKKAAGRLLDGVQHDGKPHD